MLQMWFLKTAIYCDDTKYGPIQPVGFAGYGSADTRNAYEKQEAFEMNKPRTMQLGSFNGAFVLLIGGLTALTSGAFAQTVVLPERALALSAEKYSPAEIDGTFSSSPNPFLSLRDGDDAVDWNYWRTKMAVESAYRSANAPQARVRMIHRRNRDSLTLITRFGTLPFQSDSVEIAGSFELPTPQPLVQLAEDEGSIPLATDVVLDAGQAAVVQSVIGDSDFGSAGTGSGDFDFFAIRDVKAGQLITVRVDTPLPFADLDPYVEIYDSNGIFLAANDDGNPALSFDSFLVFEAPADDDYYVSIGGFGAFFLIDPFDSSTGLGGFFGAISEGEYTATIGLDYFDDQEFLFFSRRGDVIGAAVDGTLATLSLSDRTRTERQGSMVDNTGAAPAVSPLPSGLAAVSHVVDKWGPYRLKARALRDGDFTLNIRAALPTLREGIKGDEQVVFIDFDGATVDLSESLAPGAPPGVFVTDLSPLAAFLSAWGLTAADEDDVIDAIIEVTKRSLVKDIRAMGGNRDFRIRLLNSRDHLDPFGMPNVSRVIVGGTIAELFGINTIGIAQSIDVGNFDTEETAFVLLDLLSSDDPFSSVSLNNVATAAGSSIVDVIGRGVGEIVAHEAGHYLGNWHTDQFNEQPNIMDQGGNLAFTILGLGDDGVFGTGDDVDVMFGRDLFVPAEGFTGIENTLTSIAWGATTPKWRWWWGHDDDNDGDDD